MIEKVLLSYWVTGPLSFVFGTSIGSYLITGIDRFRNHEPIVKIQWALHWQKDSPQSHCFSCGHLLLPKDVRPILSYIRYRGKCRYCGTNIPIFYPIVEATVGILFVSFIFIPNNMGLLFLLFLITIWGLLEWVNIFGRVLERRGKE